MTMKESPREDPDREAAARSLSPLAGSTWGPWLFGAVMVAVLVYFWWLLIYPHGVAPHGG